MVTLIFCCVFVGNDGVELNVLDNILGEQVNDEFADELDTATVKASGKWIEQMCHSSLYKNCI